VSLALYRKYRSRSLDEIVGQDHVTKLLSAAIKKDQVAHAYLFTGPRGTGKTSIARILAHSINDLPYDDESTHLDIIEIDAASNNGVEDIRDLRERVQIAPVSAKKKVYIIDEVHMLSKPAFNALLKTLEEPPEHVVFILATTDIDKIPETILSRTQRHSFKRASKADIVANLKRIAAAENISMSDGAYSLIATHADGSFRDSVSLFDQIRSGSNEKAEISDNDVELSLGLASSEAIGMLLEATMNGDVAAIAQQLEAMESNGVSARIIAQQLSTHIKSRLSEQPLLLPLMDSLLDIHVSSYPEMKLLTTLGLFRAPTQPEPLTVPQPSPTSKPIPTPAHNTEEKKESPVHQKVTTVPEPEPVSSAPNVSTTNLKAKAFDWDALIAHTKARHVALYSVLSKCEPEIDGGTLVLYTRTSFYKKKLDDSKYRQLLNASLAELGFTSYEIDTRPTTKPPKDSHAARVAAIMGGGEEVGVEDA
jgi:DNA polymerase-3 subunit gamma/tau